METPGKKNIVFLPYKASMWDSMESVWRAFHEDRDYCNTYVIPIPYADRKPDGSQGESHCELEEFPAYVPARKWSTVDLEAMHPDAIVIHNPYDDCNLTTSVDARYYSRNLKRCTDCLVYIPYFVLDDPPDPANEAWLQALSPFVLKPGVKNADLVMVQSEPMRESYIRLLERDTGQGRSYWESRILAMGSPKIDKVLSSKREDFTLPAQWRRMLDGRKVILYNTTLFHIIHNPAKFCPKLRHELNLFRERRDALLWWRPHPLTKSTIDAIRPEMGEEYRAIERQYREEGWGIFDDTADLHRAICWSDEYYGDGSSVVVLYRKTGKPVRLQDINDVGKA